MSLRVQIESDQKRCFQSAARHPLASHLSTSAQPNATYRLQVAFWAIPTLFGIGPQLPGAVVLSLMVGQYLLKLLIAVLDTPFVYLITGAVRRSESTTVQ